MPQYAWECSACTDRREIIASIKEYDDVSLAGKPCRAPRLPGAKPCEGIYETTFEGSSFVFKGGAPTPKFFRG